MARYQDDPRWIVVRFTGTCSKPGCGAPIAEGEDAFFYPKSGRLLGAVCGHAEQASREFDAAAADEAFQSGGVR